MAFTKNILKAESYAIGLATENLCADYLSKQGYTIITKRYKSPLGEVDIVATKADMLIADDAPQKPLSPP